jgi:hypothetical protein
MLQPQQIEFAVWYWFEGRSLVWIARTLKIHKHAVVRRRRRIVRRLKKLGLPEPTRLIHPTTTDTTTTYDVELSDHDERSRK